MDGFPSSKEQIHQLQELGVTPSHVILLEISDSKIYERLEYKMFDPVEGVYYNTVSEKPEDEEILKRLIASTEDKAHGVVKKRIKAFKDFV